MLQRFLRVLLASMSLWADWWSPAVLPEGVCPTREMWQTLTHGIKVSLFLPSESTQLWHTMKSTKFRRVHHWESIEVTNDVVMTDQVEGKTSKWSSGELGRKRWLECTHPWIWPHSQHCSSDTLQHSRDSARPARHLDWNLWEPPNYIHSDSLNTKQHSND